MKIITTIIPTNLVKNSLSFLFWALFFLLFLRRTENLIIQWALENVLIEICHIFNIYYSDIGAS